MILDHESHNEDNKKDSRADADNGYREVEEQLTIGVPDQIIQGVVERAQECQLDTSSVVVRIEFIGC